MGTGAALEGLPTAILYLAINLELMREGMEGMRLVFALLCLLESQAPMQINSS